MRAGQIIAIVCFTAVCVGCAYLLGTQAGKDGAGFDQPKTALHSEVTSHPAREWDFTKPAVVDAMKADLHNVTSNLATAWGLTDIKVDWYLASGTLKASGRYPDGTLTHFVGEWDGNAWAYSQIK